MLAHACNPSILELRQEAVGFKASKRYVVSSRFNLNYKKRSYLKVKVSYTTSKS